MVCECDNSIGFPNKNRFRNEIWRWYPPPQPGMRYHSGYTNKKQFDINFKMASNVSDQFSSQAILSMNLRAKSHNPAIKLPDNEEGFMHFLGVIPYRRFDDDLDKPVLHPGKLKLKLKLKQFRMKLEKLRL